MIRNKIEVKICGLQDPELAYKTATMNADYVGIIFHEKSKRHVDVDQAIAIARAIKKGGAQPVAVFVDQTAAEMIDVCRTADIQIVQLHGDTSRAQHRALPETIKRIYVLCVNPTGEVVNASDDYLQDLQLDRDYILFDGLVGGSGKQIKTDHLKKYSKDFKFFLAGGLNKDNVASLVDACHPYAVDVSSGVEDSAGKKSEPLIDDFIYSVNPSRKTRYGTFGGIYMPELLMAPIQALADCFAKLRFDADFKQEFDGLLASYVGRITPLTEVKQFQKACSGPRLFLKREDLLHTGAHKINNAIGQCLLAKKMGKKRIIAETGAGQHGVATATACARLGLACVVYMGVVDMARQLPNVEKMKLLGAKVVGVNSGSKTLKDAVNAALRDYAQSFETTHYCLGSALGPYPYPQMVAYFQSIIGVETQKQCMDATGKNPDLIIACIGGGSNAIGIFSKFLNEDVRLVGVEAGGNGVKLGQHAARFSGGSPGILHGCYSYLLQDANGQVANTHSISAGLDYPMIGPQHAQLYETKRVEYTAVTDAQALRAFKLLSKSEGIIPALESSHALAYYMHIAPTLGKDAVVVINLSGRGDKDLPQLIAKGLV